MKIIREKWSRGNKINGTWKVVTAQKLMISIKDVQKKNRKRTSKKIGKKKHKARVR